MIECQEYFFQVIKEIWNNFCVISLITCAEKFKTSKFDSEVTSFSFQIFLT